MEIYLIAAALGGVLILVLGIILYKFLSKDQMTVSSVEDDRKIIQEAKDAASQIANEAASQNKELSEKIAESEAKEAKIIADSEAKKEEIASNGANSVKKYLQEEGYNVSEIYPED